jgi:hypothetical protein
LTHTSDAATRDGQPRAAGRNPAPAREAGAHAFVFGTDAGEDQENIQTAWDTLRLLAYGNEPRRAAEGLAWNREQLRKIDLHWHDLRHEGASRLLGDGVDIRMIQLMLGHASVQQTQRYLNVTDEELRRGLEVSWKRARALRLVENRAIAPHDCPQIVTTGPEMWRARQDSNLRPTDSKSGALSN